MYSTEAENEEKFATADDSKRKVGILSMPSILEGSGLLNPLILLLFTLMAHGIILLNDGLYWDGWMIDSWQRHNQWSTMKRFFSEVGMPFQYYLHKIIAFSPNRSVVYRLLVLTSTYASPLAIYLTAVHFGFLDEKQALILSLLYLSYTGYHMNVDTIIVLQYTLPVAMFYWAVYITFLSLNYTGVAHWGLHLTSLFLFWLAFSANSLLVYYFGFLGLKIFLKLNSLDDVWFNAGVELLKNLDYVIFPFLFWILKERLTPRHGSYKDYNRIRLHPMRVVRSFFNAVCSGFEAPISDPIRSAAKAHFLWIAASAFVLAFYVATYSSFYFPAISQPVTRTLLIAGVLFFGFAALPYILIGQNFAPGGWATKHHVLFHLPVSLMILGISSLLFPTNVMFAAVVFILVVNMIHLNSVYLYYIAVVAKDRSWLYKLSKIDSANRNSFFYISDNHSIQGDHYYLQDSPAYSFYMFDWLWGDKTRIGIQVPASYARRLEGEQIRRVINDTTLGYDMQEVNVYGSQARLLISDGVKGAPVWVALMYLKERYLPGGKVEKVLEGVTELKYEKI